MFFELINDITSYINPSFYKAAEVGNLKVVKYLRDNYNVDIEAKENGTYTPLNIASCQGQLDVVKYLVEECNANIETEDNGGFTPISNACFKGHFDIVRYLATRNANVKAVGNIGWTLVKQCLL